jgi:HD superfamily phosphodiesterase
MGRASAAFLAFNSRKRSDAQNANDLRLQVIADHLGISVSAFTAEMSLDAADPQDVSLEKLRQAFLAAADAYTQGLRRKAQSVTLVEGA